MIHVGRARPARPRDCAPQPIEDPPHTWFIHLALDGACIEHDWWDEQRGIFHGRHGRNPPLWLIGEDIA